MAIATGVTTLTLTANKVKLPLGDKYHRHVVFLNLNGATHAEINFCEDQTGSTLFPFGDQFEKATDNESCIIHDGIAPKGGSLWLSTSGGDGSATTIKHYAYDRRQLRAGD